MSARTILNNTFLDHLDRVLQYVADDENASWEECDEEEQLDAHVYKSVLTLRAMLDPEETIDKEDAKKLWKTDLRSCIQVGGTFEGGYSDLEGQVEDMETEEETYAEACQQIDSSEEVKLWIS